MERGGLGQEDSRADEKSDASNAYPLGELTLPAASNTVFRSHNWSLIRQEIRAIDSIA